MSKTSVPKIGHLIKKLRIKKNIDVKTLAKKVNLSATRIYDLESDRRSPIFDTVIKIVYQGLDSKLSELFQSENIIPDFDQINSLIEQIESKQSIIDTLNDDYKKVLKMLKDNYKKN